MIPATDSPQPMPRYLTRLPRTPINSDGVTITLDGDGVVSDSLVPRL